MDWTTVLVAIAGIAGTLAAPVVSNRLAAARGRKEQLRTHRIEAYTDLLDAGAMYVDNMSNWSALPLARLQEPDARHMDRTWARVMVVAGPAVREAAATFKTATIAAHPLLSRAQALAQAARDRGEADTSDALRARMALGEQADEIKQAYDQLVAAIHADLGVTS